MRPGALGQNRLRPFSQSREALGILGLRLVLNSYRPHTPILPSSPLFTRPQAWLDNWCRWPAARFESKPRCPRSGWLKQRWRALPPLPACACWNMFIYVDLQRIFSDMSKCVIDFYLFLFFFLLFLWILIEMRNRSSSGEINIPHKEKSTSFFLFIGILTNDRNSYANVNYLCPMVVTFGAPVSTPTICCHDDND